jgi:hypothetical protein
MKKQIAMLLVCAVFLFSLAGCTAKHKYNANDYLGKTSAQIEEEYGKFDCCGQPVGDDGMYRNTACGYTIQEPKKGLLGSDPEWLVFIQFDENGIAYNTYEGYRPGG